MTLLVMEFEMVEGCKIIQIMNPLFSVFHDLSIRHLVYEM